jgi:hypothetical protein
MMLNAGGGGFTVCLAQARPPGSRLISPQRRTPLAEATYLNLTTTNSS